jgi:hypothetical protein
MLGGRGRKNDFDLSRRAASPGARGEQLRMRCEEKRVIAIARIIVR